MTPHDAAALQPFVSRLLRHSSIGEEERTAILDLPIKQVSLRTNQEIGRVGEHASFSTIVADGLIGRYGQGRDGERQIVALFIAGDAPDLHCAIRPAGGLGLTALGPTTVFHVAHSALRRLVTDYPAIGEAFWRDNLLDASLLAEWIINVGRRSARARLAHLFCEMAVRYAEGRGHLDRFGFPITQQQLGEVVALTSVHVNRTLKELRNENLVSLRAGTASVLDWTELTIAGDFDARYLA